MLAQKKIDFDDWAKYLQIYSMNEPTYVFWRGGACTGWNS